MADAFHRYAQGTDSGKFADGPVERTRSRFGTGELAKSSLSEEGAKARCRTSMGAAVCLPSPAANEWRQQNPKVVRVKEERIHTGPKPIEAAKTEALKEKRED